MTLPETSDIERELLETRGVTVEVSRDSLGWLKVRVRWDAFVVLEAAVADHDWRDALVYALRYVNYKKGRGVANDATR